MLHATCVKTPIDHSVSDNLHTPVVRCSASCVNGASAKITVGTTWSMRSLSPMLVLHANDDDDMWKYL